MQVLTDLIVAIDLRNLKMNIKPRLHYNVLGTARLIFWYGCRFFFGTARGKFSQCKRCGLGTRAEIFRRHSH